MAQSTTSRALIFIGREFVADLIYFPVWWYSRGLALITASIIRSWRRLVDHLSLRILLQTMGKPMYGDYTRSGRVISFFFRIFLVLTRLVVLVLWTVVYIALLGLWIAGPVVAGAMLLRQFVPIQFNLP